ncbi:hypothetical protein QNH46_23745 [Paenibacillus woosongensis]|uniref:Uncharacterized protein n=1 Tax=Paenibacillus woosongensis TaxID=307580 RepID=A0AA95I509_9BACL|nr:hypothetical protein [Paenibacillus woosongensis]WHX49021.1 hypothetical protein QNH46_23745 [Paenibacillus woosongensis]
MFNVTYRKLVVEECELINDMNPSQFIKRAWREVNGKRQLVEINYQDSDICAGSAEETIAFYFAIGCKEAVEINKELYENDPRDFQLEFQL